MLTHLHIVNYTLIENLDIDIRDGFSVITGETGAGKSIILGALNLLTGQRSEGNIIKQGAAKCYIEAEFNALSEAVLHLLESEGYEAGDSCTLRREFLVSGKSRTFVNDSPAPLSFLKALSEHLIDIHSQHQNLLLGHEEFLLDTIDALLPATLLENYQKAYATWREDLATLQKLTSDAKQSQQEEDFLRYQLEQLQEANISEGEMEELENECKTLEHANEIKESLYECLQELSGHTDIVTNLRNSEHSLHHVSDVYAQADALSERLSSVRIELDDIISEIEHTAEDIELDPKRLEFVSNRLDTIYALLKRHHVSTEAELLAIQEDIQMRVNSIDDYADNLRIAQENVAQSFASTKKQASLLSRERQKVAKRMETEILQKVVQLGMPHAKVELHFADRPEPIASGNDIVTLLFSFNKNFAPQNVIQIASGGETSRLMLALKSFMSAQKDLPTIIFDEIDNGVSGTMAEKMALEMSRMADHRQVLCITHLPQIAARGTYHFRVVKTESAESATTHIALLSPDERVLEIANMLSGETLTDAAINNAKSLLNYQSES
ncbi:MAG: DNA repair protein RecN [Alloprevotella sp.]|nr:DNA repair protein RecN [Alloprevotella sp.]